MPGFEVKYIDVDWSDRENVVSLEVCQKALELNKTSTGWHVETITFPKVFHYIGFSINTKQVKHTPYFELSDGRRQKLIPIEVPNSNKIWWTPIDKWNRKEKRYYSSLFRTAGRATLVIEDKRLVIENNTLNFSVAELEHYLADFKNSLWMLVVDSGSAAKANIIREVPEIFNDDIFVLLNKYVRAVEDIIENPCVKLVESQGKVAVRSIKPVPRTFREYIIQPSARSLTSRINLECRNTAENSYIFYSVKRVLYIIDSLSRLADGQVGSFNKKIQQEVSWKDANENVSTKQIDSFVYDNEISALERDLHIKNRTLNTLITQTNSNETAFDKQEQVKLNIRFSEPYGNWKNAFFCDFLAGVNVTRIYDYYVVKLPYSANRFLAENLSKSSQLVLSGRFSVVEEVSQKGKQFLCIEFFNIAEAKFVNNELSRLVENRKRLENAGWTVRMTSEDMEQRDMEIGVVTKKLEVYQELYQRMTEFTGRMSTIKKRLAKSASYFSSSGVTPSANFPSSMVFIQNASYGLAKTTFKKISQLNGLNEDSLKSLEAVNEVGLVNVSNLYEKWCLIKLIEILKNVFRFTLEGDWKTSLVSAILENQYNIELRFESEKLQQKILLTYEKELPSQRRPDYDLDITSKIYELKLQNGKRFLSLSGEKSSRLVLDAKFRGSISEEKMRQLVRELYSGKDYSENNVNQVFVIHPSSSAISNKTSPLIWGANNDYGQSDKIAHKYGSIFMSPSLVSYGSTDNLQRLLGMFLQDNSHVVKSELDSLVWTNMCCISCGNSDKSKLKVTNRQTEKRNDSWHVRCEVCALITVKTRCFKCAHSLFKNGIKWTYHRTRAEQTSNVLCPNCETFLTLRE